MSEEYQSLSRAMQGNLVPCASNCDEGQALVNLTPSSHLNHASPRDQSQEMNEYWHPLARA